MARQRDLQAAPERRAVDRGDDRLAERLQATQRLAGARPRRPARRLSGRACLRSFRSPPAKNVFFADVMITPAMSSFSASRRSTVASIDSAYAAFIVLADWLGSSRVRTTIRRRPCPSGSSCSRPSEGLHDRRDAHAAADAERRQAVLAAGALSSSISVPRIMPPSRRAGGPSRSRRR